MAIFKCKMCGGDLEIQEGLTICECEYCGTKQTIPALDNEKKLNLFNRANRLRLNSEFDKAASIYENIIAEFPEEAEGYWGLVLCNYGIEYVDDPATAKKIPTCHRAAFESVTKDENYELALEYADVISQKVYRDEAREIDRIMSEILSISKNEEPYDIFICYKETDTSGGRTIDSVIAQDVYDALTDKGYRVFFSRISLEDKIGKQYEPYIFAALNSAKVMLAFGTKYEYFHAVWVKNEWSRFLKLMAKDKSKSLVPCYKDMDAYDMPDEFKALQAQDMGKVGAIQDLLRGIDKITGHIKNIVPNNQSVGSSNISNIIKRANMALSDGLWNEANKFFEETLNIDAECAEAYLGKLLVRLRKRSLSELFDLSIDFVSDRDFCYAERFADESLKLQLNNLKENVSKKIYIKRLCSALKIKQEKDVEETLEFCKTQLNNATTIEEFSSILSTLKAINSYKDVSKLIDECENCLHVVEDRYNNTKDGFSFEENLDLDKYQNIFKCADGCLVAIKNDKTIKFLHNDCGNYDIPVSEIDRKYNLKNVISIDVSNQYYHGKNMIVLLSNGTVQSVKLTKEQPHFGDVEQDLRGEVSSWTDIVEISAGYSHTVGLKSDGTVVAVGDNKNGKCNVRNWSDISAVFADTSHTIGLKRNGTVVVAGQHPYCNLNSLYNWSNISQIELNDSIVVGLKKDGHVVFAGDSSGWENKEKLNVLSKWSDIKKIHMGYENCICALKNDGSVVIAKDVCEFEKEVTMWRDIVDVKSVGNCVLGLKSDGSIIIAGPHKIDYAKLLEFNNIVAIDVSLFGIYGMKSDGSFVYANTCGRDYYDGGKFDNVSRFIKQWKLFDDINSYWENRTENKFIDSNGNIYVGCLWRKGKPCGECKILWKNGEEIKGEFKDGKPFNCCGYYKYDNGYYKGLYVDGNRTGEGIYVWNNGGKYEGEFVNGKMQGKGKYFYANGSKYEGEFANNKKKWERNIYKQ